VPGPRISVVITTYNREQWITQTLASVFAQTYADFEVIVIDDGSTDGTRAVVEPFLDRIRYVFQENRGVAAAWNRGIEVSRGDILAFLASDDLWEPKTLEKVVAEFGRQPDAGLVSIMARGITQEGERTNRLWGKRTAGSDYSTTSLLWGDAGCCSWFFVRREVLDRVGLYDEKLRTAEECDLLLRISFQARMVALREPLLLKRQHDANLSKDQLSNAERWLYILQKLRREHPEYVSSHPLVYRRALGKEYLRLGRERLAQPADSTYKAARTALGRSILTFPFHLRAYLYWIWSWLMPSTFRAWRRNQVARRTNMRSHL
jgi:glycosyltransferase involved in cell wall biosynthesis